MNFHGSYHCVFKWNFPQGKASFFSVELGEVNEMRILRCHLSISHGINSSGPLTIRF